LNNYFGTTFEATLLFSLFIGQKQWREKNEEREQEDNVSIDERL